MDPYKQKENIFQLSLTCMIPRIAACLLCLFFFMHGHLSAQTDDIEAHEKEVAAIEKQEIQIIDELNDIDYRLDTKKKEVSILETDISRIETSIQTNTARASELNAAVRAGESNAASRLVALYKLNQLGKLNYLASADSIYTFFHRKTLLESILDHDQKLLNDLSKSTTDLKRVTENLKQQKQKILNLEKSLKIQIKEAAQAKKKRAALLKTIRNKKSLELAAIESLKRSALALNEKIDRLKIQSKPPSDDSSPLPRLFTDLKGLLKMPVKGRIIQFYGTYTDTRFNLVNFRSGINIEADRGEPVHAVFGGTTLFANWFKGYGNMIIVDHGDHYYTVYAHAEELFKQKGDPVIAGEVIATVGDSGSMVGPGLHFEVRHHGKPVDPMHWIDRS